MHPLSPSGRRIGETKGEEMKIRCFLAVLCLLVAATVFAKGNPNLEPLAGAWTCTGIAFASDMGPEHATRATVNSAWILDGKWLRVDYKESKTAKNPKPVAAEMVMTWNEAEKKVASGCLDNMGNYCTQESPGWDGDKMELSGGLTTIGNTVNSVPVPISRPSLVE